ncbi:MAG: hypothetical protein ACW98A_14010 [Candidatus Hodarchaeales archaeon]
MPYCQFDYTGAIMGEQRFDLGIFMNWTVMTLLVMTSLKIGFGF